MKFGGIVKNGNEQCFVVPVFFTLFFVLGIGIFEHYGVSWDENNQRSIALLVEQYVLEGDDTLLQRPHPKYHGPVVPVTFLAIERLLGVDDSRSQVLLWHFGNFLFFYVGVLFFYLLCTRRFNDWRLGLLGCLFLIVTPRIFAHSFYNHKDIPLLSLFIICVYSLITLIEKRTIKRICAHSLLCAILIDIRIIGIILPLLTIGFLGLDSLLESNRGEKNISLVKDLAVYVLLLSVFIVIFWPSLWKDPLGEIINAFNFMKKIEWGGKVLYLGEIYSGNDLPWHYLPVWIAISTPLLYLWLFAIGLVSLLFTSIKSPVDFLRKRKTDLAAVLWFFCPIGAVIAFKSVVYNDWRHLYFVYPALIIIALNGLVGLMGFLGEKGTKAYQYTVIFVVALSILKSSYVMIDQHPYQNVYFNVIVGGGRQRFDLDYWGLSYRKALEHVLAVDKRKVIRVRVKNYPGRLTARILPADQRKRLRYVRGREDYYLTNYRLDREASAGLEEPWYSIEVDGKMIMGVYKNLN